MSASHFFIMLKPDAVRRNLVGEIIRRYEMRGCQLISMRLLNSCDHLSEITKHYSEHEGKSFHPGLIKFMTTPGSRIVITKWFGNIETARKITGTTTNPDFGTVRGDLSNSLPENLVHCSDSVISAENELKIWFPEATTFT